MDRKFECKYKLGLEVSKNGRIEIERQYIKWGKKEGERKRRKRSLQSVKNSSRLGHS